MASQPDITLRGRDFNVTSPQPSAKAHPLTAFLETIAVGLLFPGLTTIIGIEATNHTGVRNRSRKREALRYLRTFMHGKIDSHVGRR
jgi:hypothetical protein